LRITGYVRPGLIYVPKLKESQRAVFEVSTARVRSLGLVDSDFTSRDMNLPVPGNDDSFICFCFFINLISRIILFQRLYRLTKDIYVIKPS
jgi:ribosomal protein S2